MKKLLIIIMFIGMAFSQTIGIKDQGCNVRDTPMGKVIAQAYPNTTYQVKDTFGPYWKVKVISTKGTSVTNNQIGWVTYKSVSKTNTGYVINSTGCNFRTGPSKDSKKLGVLLAGTVVEYIENNTTWYKISINDIDGWIWEGSTKLIK